MASHDGWLVDRAVPQLRDRPGKYCGGELSVGIVWRGKPFVSIRVIRVFTILLRKFRDEVWKKFAKTFATAPGSQFRL
jgi:hypothetical protein